MSTKTTSNIKQPELERNQVQSSENAPSKDKEKPEREIGGPKGPEPTRFGDWERNGRCSDF